MGEIRLSRAVDVRRQAGRGRELAQPAVDRSNPQDETGLLIRTPSRSILPIRKDTVMIACFHTELGLYSLTLLLWRFGPCCGLSFGLGFARVRFSCSVASTVRPSTLSVASLSFSPVSVMASPSPFGNARIVMFQQILPDGRLRMVVERVWKPDGKLRAHFVPPSLPPSRQTRANHTSS